VIGDGAMATVCCQILAEKHPQGAQTTMWGREPELLAQFRRDRENKRYLPGFRLSDHLGFEGDPARALGPAKLVVVAVPTQYIRTTLAQVAPHIPAGVPIVSVAKGIEIATLMRPTQIITDVLGIHPIAALSGPNIAGELARRLPATMVVAVDVAHRTGELAKQIQELFTNPYLRVYRNSDLIGVELAGALKNVVAIAAGILEGMQAGYNAKSALLSRGLVEIARLGVELGAMPDTFYGLAGLGDLVTTCFSPEGRNRTFGERIGRGEKAADILKSIAGVVEGVPTTQAVVKLAAEKSVDMPICRGLHAVLFEGSHPRSEIAELMARALKSE
jgi:glycerol-3-phosphate dehydrogenase (NAD(P)+)